MVTAPHPLLQARGAWAAVRTWADPSPGAGYTIVGSPWSQPAAVPRTGFSWRLEALWQTCIQFMHVGQM